MLNINEVRRIVVKVGTSTLTYDNGRLNIRRIERLVRTISDLQNRGFEMVLVPQALSQWERPKWACRTPQGACHEAGCSRGRPV